MSMFGKWGCPNCGTTWVGSIGWFPPNTQEELDKLLHNMCGCSGPIGGAAVVEISDKRKELMKEKE